MRKTEISKEGLEKLYWEDYLSVNKISKRLGVAKDTVKSLIINYGIEYRGTGPRKKVEKPIKKGLEDLYLLKKLSTRQIARQIGVVKTTVINWLKDYNITLRDNRTAKLEVKEIRLPTKEQLEEDYPHLSLELIAKKYNLTNTEPILTLLNKYGIKKRTRSESRKLALQTKRSISWNKGLTKENPKIAKTLENLFRGQKEKNVEARLKMSLTKKKMYSSGRLKSWNAGKKLSLEHVKKLSEAKKKIANTPEFKAKMREIGLKAKPKYKNTKPEKMMKKLLESANLTNGLVEQYPLIFDELGTKPDFAFPEHKVAVYCDGNYWHGGLHHIGSSLEKTKEGPRKESIKRTMKKDAKQHYTLWQNGWTPLRFWQTDIEKNSEWVIDQIKKNLYDQEYIKKREEQRKEYKETVPLNPFN